MYQRIRELREAKGMTQQQMADIIHRSRQAYIQFENGTRKIPVSVFVELAIYYGVSVDYLAGRTDEVNLKK